MAISNRFSRRIVVDGLAYRWRVPRRPSYDQIAYGGRLTAVVWLDGASAGLLRLTAPGPRPIVWFRPGVVLSPGQIVAAVRAAVRAGWNPLLGGADFHLTLPPAGPAG